MLNFDEFIIEYSDKGDLNPENKDRQVYSVFVWTLFNTEFV